MGLPAALLLILTVGPQKVAVLDVRAREGVTAGLVQIITDAVVAQVRRRAVGAKVISSDDLRTLVGFEAQKRQLGCDEMSCLTEIGGALGADLIVAGTLAKLGRSYLLGLRLIDARHASVVMEASERLRGDDQEALLDAADHAVATLFPGSSGVAPPAPALSFEATQSPHPRPLAWAFGVAGLVAGGLAVAGLVEALSFKSWKSQPPGAVIPATTIDGEVDTANTWATVALVSGLASAAGLTAAGLAW